MKLDPIKKQLDLVSPSFCLAKWTQVNLYLHSGLTHSCHHPISHSIPTSNLNENPSSLHNTPFKMEMRQKMLSGERPKECDYCWNMEDRGQMSDRHKKSAAVWSAPYLESILKSQKGEHFSPTYLEVAFDSVCNFKCAYCSPTHSSSWHQEIKSRGPYPTQNQHHALNPNAFYSQAGDEEKSNPYTEAFWRWWPELSKNLHTLRITGGEPLLSKHTWVFLDQLIENPMPHLEISINSNLGVSRSTVERFIEKLNQLEGKVKDITVFTSMETVGVQAEYIRFGLNFSEFQKNTELILSQVRQPIRFWYMVTANALSLVGMKQFMKWVEEQKNKFPQHDIAADTSYLRHPSFMSAAILPAEFCTYVEDTLEFMVKTESFKEIEINGVKNLIAWMKQPKLSEDVLKKERSDFYKMFSEYDLRRSTDFEKTFPEYKKFWQMCQRGVEAQTRLV